MTWASYEWDIETLSGPKGTEDIEVIDHDHRDALSDYAADEIQEALDPNSNKLLGLVRDDHGGRSWAYVDSASVLNTHFYDAYERKVAAVPKKFLAEFGRELKKLDGVAP
jgi:hypothetical protein